jgi:hypothetical protein
LVEITSGADHRRSPTPEGGRPASRFRFRGEYGFVLGAELSKHCDRILVCDLSGRIRHLSEFHEPIAQSGRQRLATLAARLTRVVSKVGGDTRRWLGLGLALSGGIGTDGRIGRSPIFADLEGCSPEAEGISFGDVPLFVEHDLNAAAMAEHVYGAARQADTFAHVLAWHQIAAGVVLDGRIHRGSRNLAGELGMVDDDLPAPAHWMDTDTFLPVSDAVARGDAASVMDLNAFADRAARQIAYLALAIDPPWRWWPW